MDPVTTVIITGGAGHLGRAVAHWWARPGANLVLIDRDKAKLAECRNDLAPRCATLAAITADVTDPEETLAAAESLPDGIWSRPTSLVLAHGVAGRRGAASPQLGDLELDEWRAVLNTNLTSVVFAIQAFLPLMKAAGGGRIVVVSSAAGLSASPTAALSYSVSKAAVAALPRLLAPQLAASQVLINAVAPGKFANPDWPDEVGQVERYKMSVPLGRLATADEVAALIGFLSSDANTYLTGQTVLVDGGRLAGAPKGGQR